MYQPVAAVVVLGSSCRAPTLQLVLMGCFQIPSLTGGHSISDPQFGKPQVWAQSSWRKNLSNPHWSLVWGARILSQRPKAWRWKFQHFWFETNNWGSNSIWQIRFWIHHVVVLRLYCVVELLRFLYVQMRVGTSVVHLWHAWWLLNPKPLILISNSKFAAFQVF
jgi:hypothetical protein